MPFVPSVALLGTGTMGVGMTHAMRRAGIAVTVWNRHPERALPLGDSGATVAETAEDAVRDADVVITMLFDADSVAAVMEPVLPRLKPGAVWVQSSTVGRAGIARLIELARPHGIPFVDAPVLGTKQPAEDGKLTVLASGAPGLQAVLEPVFDAIGAKTLWVGDEPGVASALKLVGNAWIASITAATAQGVALARGFGLPPERFLEAIAGGAADSPYLQAKGRTIIEGATDDAQFALDGVRKDLGLIRAAASEASVGTVLLDALLTAYGTASDAGRGSHDMSAVIVAFEPDHD